MNTQKKLCSPAWKRADVTIPYRSMYLCAVIGAAVASLPLYWKETTA